MNFIKTCLLGLFVTSNLNQVYGSKYMVKFNNQVVNGQFNDPKINSSDLVQVGDFSFYIIESDYTFEELNNIPDMEIVEEDGFMTISDTRWGLDRLDQKSLPLDNKEFDPENNGEDIQVYVIDTGIMASHVEFENTRNGPDIVGAIEDGHGHGTHVASSIAGKTTGIANKATVIGVKVLNDNGSGSTFGVIKGIEWVVKDSLENNYCSIINMSLGGSKSELLNKAVEEAVKKGVHVVVAAGNESTDACSKSPASAENAITVGSTDKSDTMSYFSNSGSCVDIFAPGSRIFGAGISSDVSYVTMSGTSMASPHVAGALAVFLNKHGCDADIDDFLNQGVENKLKKIPEDSVNLLLQVPTKNKTCPSKQEINQCKIRKKSGKLRKSRKCNKKNNCEWCDSGCRPIGFCGKCLEPTPEPTPLPIKPPCKCL